MSRQNLSVDWMPSSSKTPSTTMNNTFRAVVRVRRCVAMRRRRRRRRRSTTMRRRRDEAPSCDALLDGNSRRDERERHEGFIVCALFFFCAEKKTSKMTLSRSIIIRDSNQKEKNTRGVCVLCAFLCGKEERMSIILTSKMTLRSKRHKREKRPRARTRAKKESYSI